VRGARRHHDHLAAARHQVRAVDRERRLALAHDEHLGIGVPVQRRAAPRLHVDEHERGVDAVLVPFERLRARLGREIHRRLEHQRLHAHTSPS
jgi:hypothetical protein